MKVSHVITLAILPGSTLASRWFSGAGKQADTVSDDSPEPSSNFNPSELLEFRTHKPEVYTNAMVELKRLEQEPICHRTAAQLLMDNCRGIEEMDASSAQWGSPHIQRHHVESFANGLTMCDMERAKFVIPKACAPFGSSALYRAARDKHSQLDITQEQVTDCLEALGRDHSHWNTWLSNRDKAVTICRAARLDIEKDQAILVHKQLIELMQQFTKDVDLDLTILNEKLKASSTLAESFVDDLTKQAEDGKAKINTVFESVSQDMKGVDAVIKSIFSSGNDVLQMFKTSMQTVLQANAAMASEQEESLAVATSSFQQRVGGLNLVVSEAESNVLAIQNAMQQLVPMVLALHERQNALEEKAEAALSAVMNATELLQSHTQNLQQASVKASGINEELDRAVATARTWQESLSASSSMPDWAMRVLSPATAVVLGNYGVPRTTVGNLALLIGGYAGGEMLVKARHAWEEISLPCTVFTTTIFRTLKSQLRDNYDMPSMPSPAKAPTGNDLWTTTASESAYTELHLEMM